MQTYGRAICLMKILLELFSSVVCEIAFSMQSDLQKIKKCIPIKFTIHPSILLFLRFVVFFKNRLFLIVFGSGSDCFKLFFSLFLMVFDGFFYGFLIVFDCF